MNISSDPCSFCSFLRWQLNLCLVATCTWQGHPANPSAVLVYRLAFTHQMGCWQCIAYDTYGTIDLLVLCLRMWHLSKIHATRIPKTKNQQPSQSASLRIREHVTSLGMRMRKSAIWANILPPYFKAGLLRLLAGVYAKDRPRCILCEEDDHENK